MSARTPWPTAACQGPAETARTRAYLDGLPVRARLHERLEKYISESSPRYYSLTAAGGDLFAIVPELEKQLGG